ncbi:GNAT family N-acetyltransferase [Pseudomonas sp. 2FE]|uniref:GNAT family N-acetyltransferase n=1 Tax=Pseudomonas sp. 2FE TaxID=2502190 RepID=UPI0010F5BC49|nr:GNAT family N-acetyltransferase [Pseudomonas sp. 2FE]
MVWHHRLATQADLPQIVTIYNSTIASRQVTADLEPISVHSRVQWFAEHQADRRPLWVVEQAGEVVGWLSFSSFYGRPAYARTAELSIYLDQAWRGQGLGKYLLEQALKTAPALGLDNVLGFIFGHNTASLALFARLGFQRWGQLPRVALLDGVERDLVIVGCRVAHD